MTRQASRTLLASLFTILTAAPALAGGPLLLRAPGQPFLWAGGGVGIPFNPDQGGLGPLTNAQAIAQTTAAFAAWEAIPSARATHTNAGTLPVDVDETNFVPFFAAAAPDGLSAIVYDEDGAIFNLLFGPNSGILGFASPEWINNVTGEIVEGYSFMNGGSLIGPGAFPVAEFLSVQVHEFGHYQNLAHTVVNGQAAGFGDTTGPTPFDTFPRPATFAFRIETMYPFLFVNGGQATPHPDDVAIFSTLYPEPGFASSTGSITGRILAPNGTTPVTGVNVIARNVANPYDDAVSAISSDFTDNYTPGGPFVGVYTIRGLTPGASYAVFVDEILAGGFSTPPRVPLPGPEEFYNGAGESNDFVADVPSVFTAVVPAAGRAGHRHQHHLQPAASRADPADGRLELRDLHRLPDPLLRHDLRVGVGERERQPDVRRRQLPRSWRAPPRCCRDRRGSPGCSTISIRRPGAWSASSRPATR